MTQYICGGQRVALRTWFFPFILVVGVKRQSPGSAAHPLPAAPAHLAGWFKKETKKPTEFHVSQASIE